MEEFVEMLIMLFDVSVIWDIMGCIVKVVVYYFELIFYIFFIEFKSEVFKN